MECDSISHLRNPSYSTLEVNQAVSNPHTSLSRRASPLCAEADGPEVAIHDALERNWYRGEIEVVNDRPRDYSRKEELEMTNIRRTDASRTYLGRERRFWLILIATIFGVAVVIIGIMTGILVPRRHISSAAHISTTTSVQSSTLFRSVSSVSSSTAVSVSTIISNHESTSSPSVSTITSPTATSISTTTSNQSSTMLTSASTTFPSTAITTSGGIQRSSKISSISWTDSNGIMQYRLYFQDTNNTIKESAWSSAQRLWYISNFSLGKAKPASPIEATVTGEDWIFVSQVFKKCINCSENTYLLSPTTSSKSIYIGSPKVVISMIFTHLMVSPGVLVPFNHSILCHPIPARLPPAGIDFTAATCVPIL